MWVMMMEELAMQPKLWPDSSRGPGAEGLAPRTKPVRDGMLVQIGSWQEQARVGFR
jgi:hypothetical protein